MILKNNGFRTLEYRIRDVTLYNINKYLSNSVSNIPSYFSPRKGGPYTYQKYTMFYINNNNIATMFLTTELIRVYTYDKDIII